MNTLVKHAKWMALSGLFLFAGIAKAACNDANGTEYILEMGGYTGSTVELGVTNTFTLRIKNAFTGVYLTSGQIDAGAITWDPGEFSYVDSNGDDQITGADLHVISIKLVAGSSAESASGTDTKPIICSYNASGWNTYDDNDNFVASGCQTSTAKLCVNTDADGDGLTYLDELQLQTDPNNADTDRDGLPDGYEVWHSGFDPLQSDADQDDLDDYDAAMLVDPDGDQAPDWYEDWKDTNPGDFFDEP